MVRYRHVGLRSADLMLVSYPKSGSTWLRFVLANALTGDDMDFDAIRNASPPVGQHRGAPGILPSGGRLVKSHERPRFVGTSARPAVLYLVRDGRDVAVSFYHHLQRKGSFDGDLDRFIDEFLEGRASVFGSWRDHVRSWSDYSHRPGREALFIRYEDLLTDPQAVITDVDRHFGLGIGSERIAAAVAANSKTAMRDKEASSQWLAAHSKADIPFVRRAEAGGWHASLSPAAVARLEAALGPELAEMGYALTGDGSPGG